MPRRGLPADETPYPYANPTSDAPVPYVIHSRAHSLIVKMDHLLATVSALKNGLTSLPLGSAMDNAETWQQQLLQSGEPALQDVARELGKLQSMLSDGELAPAAIGRSLAILGDQTGQAAATASAECRKPLTELADLLRRHAAELQAHAAKKA